MSHHPGCYLVHCNQSVVAVVKHHPASLRMKAPLRNELRANVQIENIPLCMYSPPTVPHKPVVCVDLAFRDCLTCSDKQEQLTNNVFFQCNNHKLAERVQENILEWSLM